MDDPNMETSETQASQPTAAQPRPDQPPAGAAPKGAQKKKGMGFRRGFFVFLLLFVAIGLIVIGAVASARFGALLGEVDSLNARLDEAQTALDQARVDLAQAQTDLDSLRQDLSDLSEESASAQTALESQVRYGLLLQQAQNEVAKAIVSLAVEDDIGQARREITALRASLLAAADLADEASAAALADLEVRAGQAQADLSANAFAAQSTLEVIWHDLDELSAATGNSQ
jgi:chromosome segregation ATPase